MSARRILYIQYTNPAGYPPLQHSSRILADAGWQVLFLGTGAHGANALRFPPHPNITVRQMPFCPAGWRQKLHYLRYALWALYWTMRWRPQWIYASDPLVCPVARLVSWVPGVRIVYHEHDSPVPVAGDGRPALRESEASSRFQRWVFKARERVARRARLCIVPNEVRLRHFASAVGVNGSARCVWNCPSRQEVFEGPARPANGAIGAWYHGSIVPDQLPETIVRALALLPREVSLHFAGYETVGHPGYVAHLLELANQLGVADRVRYLGTLPDRASLLELCYRYDVGVALFPRAARQPMVGASNKPFDYLACGLALLVSDSAEWRDSYVAPGLARACDPKNPESIANALRWFLEYADETREIRKRGRQQILESWNYESQFGPIFALMSN
jgi:glycosyltransferase involved in cell wall biosynthesis